ncbi:MAG TPA: hypothetical protein VNO70_00220 [Blastocatellia bacterium]|nr:hypothetical protein [Blastocatellia bacterium]
MRRALIICAVAAMAIGFSLTAASALDNHEMTIKGEVIDQPCYEGKNGARGEAHKSCALACAKRGNQMAIIDANNVVYSITGDYAANKNEKLIPFVAEVVEAKGVVTEKDGKKFIAVSSIKKAE